MHSFIEPTLWKHQEMGVSLAEHKKEFAFLFDVGTGKTLTAISTCRKWYAQSNCILPTLVLSPKVTLNNWKDEWHTFSKVTDERVLVLKGATSKRIKDLRAAIAKYGRSLIVVTNYEGLRSSDFFKFLKDEFSPSVLICDESHRCKTFNSKTTKMVTMIADKTEYKILLTGTLITNTESDIFSQWRILDGGKSFGRNYYHFRNTFFFDANSGMPKDKYFPDFRIRKGAYDKMEKHLQEKSLKALKEECIDLPELVKKVIKIDMTKPQRKIYNDMKSELVAELETGSFASADIALTKLLRLTQISSGFIKDENGLIHRIKNNKEDALKDLLFDLCKEGNQKVIVWAVATENYNQIREVCTSLKLRVKEGHGGIKDVANEVAEFDKGDYDVLIGHPASIGIGVNIKSASTAIYFSKDFSLEKRLQSEARNFRGGSIDLHSKITHIDLVTADSVEEDILLALENKLTTANKILDLVKSSLGN